MTHQKIKIPIISLFFVAIVFAGSCYKDKSALLYPGSSRPVNCNEFPDAKFSGDRGVKSIITKNCNIPQCHNKTSASGGYVFQNYSQISDAIDLINTKVVVEKTMPPTGALLPAEINIINCWIQNGAPDN